MRSLREWIMPGTEDRRPESSLRKKAATLFCVILVLALAVGSLFGDRGILQLVDQKERAARLAQELEDLRAENLRLAGEIQSLRTDPRAIERLAREELGLARPGETVFLIRDEALAEHP
jgi:cell division protein FtsB